ncbi:MAG: hypothetical protein ABR954_08535 [Dehalococcoidales bacterium]
MVTTFLSDIVITPTELRTKQKHWLDRATENVITIANGHKKLALIDRERVSKLFAQKHYSELVIKYCQEIEKKKKSDTFPWVEFLNNEGKLEFRDELLVNIMIAITTDEWLSMENLIEDWKATAETNSKPKIAKALLAKEDPSKYVNIKD